MGEQPRGSSDDRFATLATGITLCYREHGSPDDPTMLLVAGLGEDLIAWESRFVESLVRSGFQVVTMDNRDSGRSSFVDAPPPAVWRQALGRPRPDAYSLADMAQDCLGLLDHLGVERAHLVGRSMGGMIAQVLAAEHPDRVASLASLYSTTGASTVGQPTLATKRILLAPAATTSPAAVRAHLRITEHMAGADHPIDEVAETQLAVRTWDRAAGDQAAGQARQIQAIQSSGDRTAALARVTAPTLVINGDRDRMVAVTGGAATATAVRNARHLVIPGMGHHLPATLAEPVAHHVAQHAHDAACAGPSRTGPPPPASRCHEVR